jgi:hypothetical protein
VRSVVKKLTMWSVDCPVGHDAQDAVAQRGHLAAGAVVAWRDRPA